MSGSGEIYESLNPALYGGNKKEKIYGRLDCPSANRYLNKGYEKVRVFFASIDDAIAAGYRPCAKCMKKEYIEWKRAAKQTENSENVECGKENELKGILTKSDFKKAFGRVGLSENQIKLLHGWYEEGRGNWATPELLKNVMGYEETGRVNIDVGSIGKLIIENLRLDPNGYMTPDSSQTAYWSVYCDQYDNEKGWHFSSEFFNALLELHVISV